MEGGTLSALKEIKVFVGETLEGRKKKKQLLSQTHADSKDLHNTWNIKTLDQFPKNCSHTPERRRMLSHSEERKEKQNVFSITIITEVRRNQDRQMNNKNTG